MNSPRRLAPARLRIFRQSGLLILALSSTTVYLIGGAQIPASLSVFAICCALMMSVLTAAVSGLTVRHETRDRSTWVGLCIGVVALAVSAVLRISPGDAGGFDHYSEPAAIAGLVGELIALVQIVAYALALDLDV